MDEQTAEIEHLIQHYLNRDLFRIYGNDFLHRKMGRNYLVQYLGSIAHYSYDGGDWRTNNSVIHFTREGLKRAKPVTRQYLHNLLHNEPMLSIHEHVHADGVIFTYVIQEPEF